MGIVERGEQEAKQQEERNAAIRLRWLAENKEHTIDRFRIDFYREHYKPNPDYKGMYGTRYIVDPPFPDVTDWRKIGPGDTRAPSEFVCEGIRYRCAWEYKGGGDRAYWDDGYWPKWFVRVKRWRLLPFKAWLQVHGPEQVARAVRRAD